MIASTDPVANSTPNSSRASSVVSRRETRLRTASVTTAACSLGPNADRGTSVGSSARVWVAQPGQHTACSRCSATLTATAGTAPPLRLDQTLIRLNQLVQPKQQTHSRLTITIQDRLGLSPLHTQTFAAGTEAPSPPERLHVRHSASGCPARRSTVGGGQALDQLQTAVAVLELEELLMVDFRSHVERAKRLPARGRVQDDENARYSLAEVEQRHWSN